ncbi:MAG: hypothetical protein IAG13_38375, partial [Deltaproteobacteria bacterium]|nr:hypothetical protein [Nannocystaceae bacterium]
MAQAGTDVDGTQAMVRIDPVVRPPALYRIPFSLAAAGILLIAMQAGKPVIGLVLLFTVMFTTASVAWRSFSRRHAPALALRAQADRALRVGSYGEARV